MNGVAESGLNPRAKSRAGALGVMQILPPTFAEIKTKNPAFRAIWEPRWNIAAGISYDRYLYDRWKKRSMIRDRLAFAFASYNAGYSRISRGYRKKYPGSSYQVPWANIAQTTPKQTQHYIKRIIKLMKPAKGSS